MVTYKAVMTSKIRLDRPMTMVVLIMKMNLLLSNNHLSGVVREHSVKTPNADYCNFHMEI